MQGSLETILAEHHSTEERVEALRIYYGQSLLLPPDRNEFTQAVQNLLGIFDAFKAKPEAEFLAAHFELDWIKLLERLPPDAWKSAHGKALMQLIRGPWLPLIEPRLIKATDEHNVTGGDVNTYYEKEGGLYQDIHRSRQLRVREILSSSLNSLPRNFSLNNPTHSLIAFIDHEPSLPAGIDAGRYIFFGVVMTVIVAILHMQTELPKELLIPALIISLVGVPAFLTTVEITRHRKLTKPLQERWDQALEGFDEIDYEQWNKTLDAMETDSGTKTKVRVPTAEDDIEAEPDELEETNQADETDRRRRD
jgi:hypothetical protein